MTGHPTDQPTDVYTFGDNPSAARRLGLLADLYAPRMRDLLARVLPDRPVRHAVDLGCGPGHTTRLLHEAVGADRTTGVERSEEFLALARAQPTPGITFVAADVARPPLPVDAADVVHARFLLTHLAAPAAALRSWASALADGGRLVVQESAAIDSEDPGLHRYYALVADLQRRHGQELDIGARLPALAADAGLAVSHTALLPWRPDPAAMAGLHLPNLRTWRHDPYIVATTDPAELDALDADLLAIARGRPCAPVEQTIGEAVLTR